jgi:hypothetical protein
MDAEKRSREERRQQLLRELAELEIDQLTEEGVFLQTPHYSVIELAALRLGRELSVEAQQRAAREVAAECGTRAACPTCGTDCPVQHQKREVTSLTGPVELLEAVAHCPKCRRSFFPSAD